MNHPLHATLDQLRDVLNAAETRLNQIGRQPPAGYVTQLTAVHQAMLGLAGPLGEDLRLLESQPERDVLRRLLLRLGLLAALTEAAANTLAGAEAARIVLPPHALDELAVMWGELAGPTRLLLAQAEGYADAATQLTLTEAS